MEDAATAEIARAQLWQWVHLPTGILDEGRNVTIEMFRALLDEELDAIRQAVGDERFTQGKFRTAAEFLDRITAADEFVQFITTELYDLLP